MARFLFNFVGDMPAATIDVPPYETVSSIAGALNSVGFVTGAIVEIGRKRINAKNREIAVFKHGVVAIAAEQGD